MKKIILGIIIIYQKTLSPDHGLLRYFFPRGACSFYPTCSEYMCESIKKFGILKGVTKGIKRIARCHPWGPGGYDPA